MGRDRGKVGHPNNLKEFIEGAGARGALDDLASLIVKHIRRAIWIGTYTRTAAVYQFIESVGFRGPLAQAVARHGRGECVAVVVNLARERIKVMKRYDSGDSASSRLMTPVTTSSGHRKLCGHRLNRPEEDFASLSAHDRDFMRALLHHDQPTFSLARFRTCACAHTRPARCRLFKSTMVRVT
ncbi:hypothetical protein C8R43DRAFT_1119791 [Mycena crocata]|nr:hypothetical protein C8R43DRAFT_1119791 [Mycena crocata]